ncbi:MAG: hypothetical protein KKG00_05235 [Bacteroidetes bacterium]|nr:hypothetical protein [Bacteroidota bacterium]
MAHEEKKNKNIKKVATKAPKVRGAAKVPNYEKNESGITPPDLSQKVKKGAK